MVKYIKKCEQSMMISTLLTLVMGIVLIINPSGSIKFITSIIACMFALIGVFQLFDYLRMNKAQKYTSLSLIIGIICVIASIYLFCNLTSLVSLFTSIIGIAILIKGLFKIQFAFNLKGISEKWTYNLIVGIVSVGIALLLIANPFKSAELFLRIIGVVFVIASITELVETFMVVKTLDDVKELDFIEKPKKHKHDNDMKK